MKRNKTMATKYTDKELLEFKKLLEDKYQENLDQIKYMKEHLVEITESGKDENSMENSSYNLQVEQLLESISRINKYNQLVVNALTRIKNNVYGICAETGEKIDTQRLKAVPTTTLSIKGKQIRELKS